MTSRPGPTTDWTRWHDDYADPASALSARLDLVVRRSRAALDSTAPGPVTLLSVCAGQGNDVERILRDHRRAADVDGLLVEADPDNARRARERLDDAGLARLEVRRDDASLTDVYQGSVPAQLVLLCGIFGNVSDADVERTIGLAPMLAASGGVVVWTRHRRSPDLTPAIRRWFADAGFEESSFDSPGPDSFSVGVHRLVGPSLPLERGLRLFEFLR
jgi:hypothetical protein